MESRLAAPALLAVIALGCSAAADDKRVIVDPSRTHQTMSGWEATPRLWEMDKENDRYDGSWLVHREEIARALVEDAGVNRIRLEIASGAENPVDYWSKFVAGEIGYKRYKDHLYEKINDNGDARALNPAGVQFAALDYYVENLALPMKRLLEARGERLIVNLCYVDFRWSKLAGSLSHASRPEEYAELIDAALEHLSRKYGLSPDFVEIILEPDNTRDWSGDAIGDAIVALDARLSSRGVRPTYVAPSTSHATRTGDYLDRLARNAQAANLVGVVSYHRYDGPRADGALPRLAAKAEKIGATIEMLEYVGGRAEHLFADIKAGASAWQRYGVAAKADAAGKSKPGYLLEFANGEVALKPGVAAMAEIFRNVREGAVRIDAAAEAPGVDAVAFRNRDGRHAVFVLAAGAGPIAIEGLPKGRYRAAFAPKGAAASRNLGVIAADDRRRVEMSVDAPGVLSLVAAAANAAD
ncbi:MAG: hypothetical protein HXY21_05440 [Parvularculaceae bacterium]|nr:hypothetical protein [Parvularculaceae bacterium]